MAGDKENVPVQRFDAENSKTIESSKGGIAILVAAQHVVATVGDRVLYETPEGETLECVVLQQTAGVLMVLEEA